MEILRELSSTLFGNFYGTQQLDLIALVIFAATLVFLGLRLRHRIRVGLTYLETLSAKADDIAKSVADAARATTLAQQGGSTENALTVPSASLTLDDLLSPGGNKQQDALRQPLSELQNGLLGYSDNLTATNSAGTGAIQYVAFQRLSDAFSAQLPERFVAAAQAMTFSRLAVQAGLAFSVLFILVALVSEDPADILRNIRFKFGFTVLGLATSLFVQIMIGGATRRGRLAFLKFENELNRVLSADVMSPLAGSYQLLQDQRLLKEEFKNTLDKFSDQIGSLKDSAKSLGTSTEKAANTLTQVMTATSSSSEKIAGMVEEHMTKMIGNMEEAHDSYKDRIEVHASAVISRYSSTLKSASAAFKSSTEEAGTGFQQNVASAGKGFNAGLGAATEAAAADIGTASRDLSTSAQQSADLLSASHNRVVEGFETQFETAARRYLASVKKIGDATTDVASIQAAVLSRINSDVESARRRIHEVTETEIERAQTEIIELAQTEIDAKKREIDAIYRKTLVEGWNPRASLGTAELGDDTADATDDEVSLEGDLTDAGEERRGSLPPISTPDSQQKPSKSSDKDDGFEV